MSLEVDIADAAWTAALPDAEALCIDAAEQAFAFALAPAPGSARTGEGGSGVAILLTSDAEVRDLNARFRGQDRPTNVLSFPAPAFAQPHLGDVALAFGTCAREAAEQGKRLSHHLQHLVAHGVLHLLGYDHETDAEAEVMEGLEREILARLSVGDPYAASGE